MSQRNITASGAVTHLTGKCSNVEIMVNAALTGTIAVLDGTTTIATITNPTVGSRYVYHDFGTSVIVNPSTTCDITVWANTGRRL